MNLMFWKKKNTNEDSADGSQKKSGDRNGSRKSLGHESLDKETSEGAHRETADVNSAYSKRRLIISAAIGLLTLAAIGLVILRTLQPSPDQNTATAGAPTLSQPMPFPEDQLIKLPPIEFPQLIKPQSKDRQTDIEALQKKNKALQTQIEALKTGSPQAGLESLKKNNDELQTQIGTLKAELPKIERAQAEQNQANIDALAKKNNELQAQIEALKAELPRIERAQAEQHQANINALTKKNNELQAQIETLKKKQQQLPSASTVNPAAGKAQPTARSGNVAIGSKNPKAAAMTLKEAIEAMNESSGDPPKEAAK